MICSDHKEENEEERLDRKMWIERRLEQAHVGEKEGTYQFKQNETMENKGRTGMNEEQIDEMRKKSNPIKQL